MVGQELQRRHRHFLGLASPARRFYVFRPYAFNASDSLTERHYPAGRLSVPLRRCMKFARGQELQIVDISLRMLQPRELFRAQGFPHGYIIAAMLPGAGQGPDPRQLRA